jgi:hypothetical protein
VPAVLNELLGRKHWLGPKMDMGRKNRVVNQIELSVYTGRTKQMVLKVCRGSKS